MEDSLKGALKGLRLNESTISTILGALVTVVIGILIFNYFKQIGKVEQISEEPAAVSETVQEAGVTFEKTEEGELVPQNLPVVHKVKAGESLWKVAEKYYGSGYNWVDVVEENKLECADQLAVGQELNIPKVRAKQLTKPEVVAAATDVSPIEGDTYKVQEGDNLWEIAVRAYQDGYQWPKIAEANNLANPNYLEVDQELKLSR